MAKIKVKYRCQHPSCVVNCREGLLTLENEEFSRLKSAYEDETLFRSPRGICRLGFNQKYKIVRTEDVVEGAEEKTAQGALNHDDPIQILKADHQEILKVLDDIEANLRKRDMDALWVLMHKLENDLMLHSVRKEEGVLFNHLMGMAELGEGLIAIVKEDHREVVTLLYSFKNGLEEGIILDGIAKSIVTSLKSHIRKEDGEFFELLDKFLEDDARKSLFEGFGRAKAAHTEIVAGERKLKVNTSREELDAAIADLKEMMDSCCH